jgi:hypothetical protein
MLLFTGMESDRYHEVFVFISSTILHMLKPSVVHTPFWPQLGTPWSDGTEGVTQCPILPGETFIYKFVVDRVSPLVLIQCFSCNITRHSFYTLVTNDSFRAIRIWFQVSGYVVFNSFFAIFVEHSIISSTSFCRLGHTCIMGIMECKEQLDYMDPSLYRFLKEFLNPFPMIMITT